MKQLALLLLAVATLGAAAQKSADAQLDARLQQYLAYNKDLNFEKVMDYMHPKLFTVAPREALLASMQQAFTNDQMKFRFDSMAIVSVGPVYRYLTTAYRKVSYFISLTMTFSDSTDLSNPEVSSIMRLAMQNAFPAKKITVDTDQNSLNIAGTEIMFAIKDAPQKEWMFLGYDKKKPQLTTLLYPKAVRAYYKL